MCVRVRVSQASGEDTAAAAVGGVDVGGIVQGGGGGYSNDMAGPPAVSLAMVRKAHLVKSSSFSSSEVNWVCVQWVIRG